MPLQVRMLTSKSLEAERKRSSSRTAKHVDEPRKQGLLDGTKPGGTRQPRIVAGNSYCVSYKLDENGNKINAKVFRAATNRKPNRRKLDEADKVELMNKLLDNKKLTATDFRPVLAD